METDNITIDPQIDTDEDTVLLAPGDLDTALEEVRTTTKRVFVIDRKKMTDGELYYRGAMCVLGQVLKQCGVSAMILKTGYEPEDIRSHIKDEEIRGLLLNKRRGNTRFANRAMEINDDYSGNDREQKLIKHFARHGYALRFVSKE